MSTTIYGVNGMTQVSQDDALKQDGGVSVAQTWKGPAATGAAKYLEFINTYGVDNVSMNIDHGLATINVDSASDVTPGSPQDLWTWEMAGGDLEKPLESFSTFAAADAVAAISEVIKEHDLGNMTYVPTGEPQLVFSKIRRRGTTAYLRSGVTLRATKRVSKRSLDLYMSWGGVDEAHRMYEPYGPGATGNGMPAAMIASMTNWPEYDETLKQWLKRAPTQRTADGKYYDLSLTWIFARKWSHTLYAGDDDADNP